MPTYPPHLSTPGCEHGWVSSPDRPADRLTATVADIERHVAASGWDQPPVLFALADTEELLGREPGLAVTLGLTAAGTQPGQLTPIEQDRLGDGPLDEALAGMMWPADVLGCALVHEVLTLPPAAEDARPADIDPVQWAQRHPERREVRLAVAVLRDGTRASVLRVRPAHAAGDIDGPGDLDGPGDTDERLTGPDLAPNLADALLATLR